MKILQICAAAGVPARGPSGASAHLRGVAWALHRADHELRLVCAREVDGRGAHGELPVPVASVQRPGWPSWLGRYRERQEAWHARRVAALARRGPPPDLIYERWSLFSDAGARVRRATGAPWILEVNAPLARERAAFEVLRDPPYAEAWQRRSLLGADRLYCVSRWLVDWLVSEIGVPADRVRLTPNGVASRRGARDATRARLGLEGRFVVGFLGSMKPWHGVQHLSEVVAAIPGAVGLAVGDGPVDPGPGVIQTGQVSEAEAADLVAAMDVGLAPYPSDAPPWFCPLKVLAYRAQGTPVIGTDVADVAALVGDGGTVVEDPGQLAEAAVAWRGRRAPPSLRSWDDVAGEILADAAPLLRGG